MVVVRAHRNSPLISDAVSDVSDREHLFTKPSSLQRRDYNISQESLLFLKFFSGIPQKFNRLSESHRNLTSFQGSLRNSTSAQEPLTISASSQEPLRISTSPHKSRGITTSSQESVRVFIKEVNLLLSRSSTESSILRVPQKFNILSGIAQKFNICSDTPHIISAFS